MQDLPRTFPGHPWLDTQEGHAALRRVLVGYSFRDSDVGYCQVRFALFWTWTEISVLISSIYYDMMPQKRVIEVLGSNNIFCKIILF